MQRRGICRQTEFSVYVIVSFDNFNRAQKVVTVEGEKEKHVLCGVKQNS